MLNFQLLSVAKATLQLQMSVRPSVCQSAKPLNSLKSSSFIIYPSSFFIHPSSSFIILHHPSSFYLHFATFKLFSFFWTLPYLTKMQDPLARSGTPLLWCLGAQKRRCKKQLQRNCRNKNAYMDKYEKVQKSKKLSLKVSLIYTTTA